MIPLNNRNPHWTHTGRRAVAVAAVVAFALLGAGSALAAGTAPTNTTPPTISGQAVKGQTLTAQPGNWNGTQPITYAYQWLSCDQNGANCTDLSGATSNSYTLASSDVGSTVRVRVTASNSGGSAESTSVPTALVRNAAPTGLTLNASRRLVVYGGSVRLTGTVAGASTGTQVTIRGYHPGSSAIFPVSTVRVAADGTFSVTMRPTMRTTYIATSGTLRSTPLSVGVQPHVVVQRLTGHRLQLKVLAAKPLAGHYVVIQRWQKAKHVWLSVQRVYLRRSLKASEGIVVSTALVRLHLGGVMTRVFVPLSQDRPAYLSATSGAFTA